MRGFSHFPSGQKHTHPVGDQMVRTVPFVLQKNLVEKGEVQFELWR